jgi:hypothetical protein
MPLFSLTVSVTPLEGLDADFLVDALVTDVSVREATARARPADSESRLDLLLSVAADSPEGAGDLAISLLYPLVPGRTVEVAAGNVFRLG